MDDFEQRRKKLLQGGTSEPSVQQSTTQNQNNTFETRRSQLITPSQEATQQNKPAQPQQQNFLQSGIDAIKKIAGSAIDALTKQTQIKSFESPVPEDQLITKPKVLYTAPATSVGYLNPFNVIDSTFKNIDSGIYLSQQAIQESAMKANQTGQEDLTLKIAKPLAFVQEKIIQPALYNPVVAPINKGFVEQYLGGSKEVMATLEKSVPPSNNPLIQGYNTVGEIAGGVLGFLAGGEVIKGFQLGKAALPVLFAGFGQLSAPSQTTVLQRMEKAPVDAVAGWMLSKVPAANKLVSKEALRNAGIAGSILSGNAFIDSLIQGLPKEDAAKAAAEMAVIAGIFHIGGSVTGLIAKKALSSEFKTGVFDMTPEQARNQVNTTTLKGTPAGDTIIKASRQAEAEGKSLQFTVQAAKQSKVAALFKADTPNGVSFGINLVDPQKVVLLSEQGAVAKAPEVKPVEPVTPKTPVKATVPSIAEAKKYVSAGDFASEVYSAKPENQIGVIAADKITPRDQIDNTSTRYEQLKADIQANGIKEPIRVTVEGDKIVTTDGSQRTAIAQELGMEVPVIVNKGSIAGLQTIKDIYESNKETTTPKQEEQKPVSFSSKEVRSAQASFTKELQNLKEISTDKEDLLKNTDQLIGEIIQKNEKNPTQLAGLRTALSKEMFGYVGKTGNYKADFAMLQQLIRVDPEMGDYLSKLEDKVAEIDAKLGRSRSSVFANTDPFSETLQNVTQELEKSQFKVVEFPEMLRMAEDLMGGNRPVATASKRGNYRGAFMAKDGGTIILKNEIFKNPLQASRTLAHELGHLMDYLPDKTMARGNLIGRLASLREFMRNNFSSLENEKKIDALLERVRNLQKQRQEIKAKYKTDTKEFKPYSAEDKQKDLELLKKMRPLNKEIRSLQKTTIKNPTIKEELLNLSAKWRPIPDGTGTADDIRDDDYRASSSELYADAISVLFNDPIRLEQEAPEFWKNFFKYLDQKPEVKDNFFKIQEILHADPEKLFRERDAAMNKAYAEAEKVFAAKELEWRKIKSSLMYQIKVLFIDKNQAIIDKVRQAQKNGINIEDSVNPIYEMAGLNYMDSKLKNSIEDTFQPVFAKAQSVTDGWNTLGKVLQLERTIYERGEMANPGGYDPKTAKDQLDALEKHTDPEEWKVIQEAKTKFREGVQKFIDKAEKAGYYTPELIKQMKANPAYASYQVVDYLDTYVSAKVYKSVGTLKDVANPATSTVMKMISLMKAIERNKVKVDTVDLIKQAFPTEIEDAKTAFNGKAQEILDPKNKDQGLVITIRDGKATGYYVDKEIAKTLGFASDDTVRMAAKVMRVISLSPLYRPLFTSLNLGFQSFNAVRDFERYWKNVPDFTLRDAILSLPRAVYRYGQAVPIAARRAAGKPDQIIKEMENSKMLGMTYNDIFKDPVDPDEQQIERVLQKIGLLEKKQKRKLMQPIYRVLEAVETAGNFIETLPKVAGYIELKGKMPQEELAHFIRTKVGSPDFRSAGRLTPISNNIFMFSNAIKEGIRADIEIATKPSKSRSGFWWKTIMATILPKIIMTALAAGLAGEWFKKRMDDVSEYDKTNYTILPLGVDENNKTVYLRIPQDETSRFIGSIFWKGLEFADKKDIQSIFDIFAVGAGQFPTVSPSFTGIGATIQYLSGENPYDSFRNRNVIPDTEFKAGPSRSFPIFADWLLKQQGAGILVPTFGKDREMTNFEKVLNAPGLSNILGRWIKVSDYGQTETNKDIQKQQEAQAAEKTLQRRELVDKYVKEWKASDKSDATKRDLVAKFTREATAGVTEDRPRQVTLAKQKIKTALDYGEYGANTDSLITANSNDTKVMILQRIEKTMSKDEFIKYKRMLRSEGIISDAVITKLNKAK